MPSLFCAQLAALSFTVFASLGVCAIAGERMIVESHTLIFDTDALSSASNSTPTIIYEDVNLFGDLLMNHPEVDTVIVSGGGGSNTAAYDIAHKIIEFGLNTIARNNCSSACTLLFLAGSERKLEKGARLGFHRSTNSAADHREFYERTKEDAGWVDEFGYAKKAHEDGQVAARDFIAYAVGRGVSLEFALEALTYSPNDMWYPDQDIMLEAGVIEGK